ncbi:hypothetical protein L1887_12503 [Cichorium endivia]|nr:hypothetical protein L1887_12503 [Cichorium endivia]
MLYKFLLVLDLKPLLINRFLNVRKRKGFFHPLIGDDGSAPLLNFCFVLGSRPLGHGLGHCTSFYLRLWEHLLYSGSTMAKRLLGSQLFVSRLSFYTTLKDLKRLFSPFGAITEARLVVDSRTQRPKGFGFVTFESDVDAQNALKAMNGKIVDGRLIFVEVAKTETPRDDDDKTLR